MIYLDNAATSYPKPAEVVNEIVRCLTEYGGNPGRGGHPLAMAAAEKIYECREAVASFLGLSDPERVVFTHNATHALNVAIKGFLRPSDHVLVSELEHNAVVRPLFALKESIGISFDTFPVLGLTPGEILAGVKERLCPNTAAIICTHASNVISATLPLAELGALCRRMELLFIVDAAQSAGHLPIDADALGIDALCAPAHKALLGIQGCGILALGKRTLPRPLTEGGSGFDSLSPQMPDSPPERFEAGTLATPAIAGLLSGIRFLGELDPQELCRKEKALFHAACERLLSRKDIRIYHPEAAGAVLLFEKIGTPSTHVAGELGRQGICVRAGLHCAPFAHRALGTPKDGAVRISFGPFNTLADVDALWQAVKEL